MRSALANSILLTLGDGTEMAEGLEGRVPFLDHHLFAFTRRLPTELKIRDGQEKWLLRQALTGHLPEALLGRAKQPFTAPPASLHGGKEGRMLLEDTLRSAAARECPFFTADAITAWLDRRDQLLERERLAWDPVLTLVVTTILAQERFGL
jgi:asparagine synthase (glutamine-hydrolysing)